MTSAGQHADQLGYTATIEASGHIAVIPAVVAPIRGRFTAMATDSAKACYYAYSKQFKTRLLSFDEVVKAGSGIRERRRQQVCKRKLGRLSTFAFYVLL
jgi:predicted aconitase